MNPIFTSTGRLPRTVTVVAAAQVATPTLGDFTAIYELYQDSILRFCRWKCRDQESGQDLMQQAFLRFYICLQRNEKVVHARAFLYRIARNLIIDHWRKKKEESLDQLAENGFEPSVDTWQQTYSALDSEKWVRKLHALPKQYREVLQYRLIQGLPPAEIAKRIGKNSNVVSVCIHRGLKRLRA